MNIFVYWEGPRPAWIDVCIRSMQRCFSVPGIEFHLIGEDNVGDYIPSGTFHRNFSSLSLPAHRSDCIRAALLAIHGGLYMDADTIAIRPPHELNTNDELTYIAWDKMPWRVINGYIYAAKGSRLAAKWLEGVNRSLARPPREQVWTWLGEKIVTPLSAMYGARRIERDVFLPIDVDHSPETFFTIADPFALVKPHTVAFGLNHSWMVKNYSGDMRLSLTTMSYSPLLIHRLITWAHENENPHSNYFGSWEVGASVGSYSTDDSV